MYVLYICVPKHSERIFKQHGNKRQRLVNSEFLLSTRPKQTRPAFLPPSLLQVPRGSRWHSSHFLDNSHNAVGGYSNKGGTAPEHKTLKAADGRDSSGCATIHEFARIETNKGRGQKRRALRRPSLRIASDLSRGTQECAIITQRCGPTVRLGRARSLQFLQLVPRARRPIINSRRKIRRFEGETEMSPSQEETSPATEIIFALEICISKNTKLK